MYVNVNHSRCVFGIFRENYVDTMAADGLAPCVAKSSEPRELTVQDKRFLIFHEEGFQRPLPNQCLDDWKMQ